MTLRSFLRAVLVAWLVTQPATMPSAFPGNRAVLLVANPQVQGPYFGRSVVLVTRHGRGAAVGLVLNRPSSVSLARPGDSAGRGGEEQPVYVGGPVDLDRTVFLRRSPEPLPGSLNLLGDIYMSENRRLLEEALDAGLPATRLRVFKGFSAWAPGQLEREIERKDWLVLPAAPDLVFAQPEGLWERLMLEHHGGLWARLPSAPSLAGVPR
jgi:putative transcriptional regulator